MQVKSILQLSQEHCAVFSIRFPFTTHHSYLTDRKYSSTVSQIAHRLTLPTSRHKRKDFAVHLKHLPKTPTLVFDKSWHDHNFSSSTDFHSHEKQYTNKNFRRAISTMVAFNMCTLLLCPVGFCVEGVTKGELDTVGPINSPSPADIPSRFPCSSMAVDDRKRACRKCFLFPPERWSRWTASLQIVRLNAMTDPYKLAEENIKWPVQKRSSSVSTLILYGVDIPCT